MEGETQSIITYWGPIGAALVAVTGYFVKKELIFIAERKEKEAMLEAARQELKDILKESLTAQFELKTTLQMLGRQFDDLKDSLTNSQARTV